jgi:hypothetical protein
MTVVFGQRSSVVVVVCTERRKQGEVRGYPEARLIRLETLPDTTTAGCLKDIITSLAHVQRSKSDAHFAFEHEGPHEAATLTVLYKPKVLAQGS